MLGKSFRVRRLSELDEPGYSLQSSQVSISVDQNYFINIMDGPVLTANRVSILPVCRYG